jgi:16S rRNA (uracil1498-N3)-methyltransferase
VNLLLLDSDDFVDESRAVLHDHRYQHVTRVQRAKIGDRLRVGMLDGLTGSATVEAIGDRPKMLRRILRSVCELGIEHLLIINSYRVEKSFWQSPALQPEAIRTALVDGLQQARDTRPPRVDLKPLFKPFVEDELAAITDTRQQALVAHPGGAVVAPGTQLPTVLAIGPEGGFIDFEIDLLQGAGFATLDLGPRILRVENAVTFGVARLFG